MPHTPGPWKWARSGLEPCVIRGTVEGEISVDDEDAALIAAAPELLAALERISRAGWPTNKDYRHIAEVIKKAKGEA